MAETILRLEIRGVVQGVGYRCAMVAQARQMGVRGWVRNRQDGSVEATVAGPSDTIEKMVGWARKGPRGALVDTVDVFAGAGVFDSFEQWPTP